MVEKSEKLAMFLYFDADDRPNGLEALICQNVLDVTSAALSDNLEIFVYLDRRGEDTREEGSADKFDNVYSNWFDGDEVRGGRLYGKVVKQSGGYAVQWDASVKLEERDSSLPSTLSDFMTWAAKQTTADHYVVWMSDHGSGISGGFVDYSAGYANSMLPIQYSDVLKTYSDKLDVVVFDACLMADAEAAGSMSGIAEYVVSSEQVVGGKGVDYKSIFSGLASLASFDAKTIARTIIDCDGTSASGSTTLSSISLDDGLSQALQVFGKASASFTEDDWTALIDAFHNPHYYYYGSYADLIEVLKDSSLAKDSLSQNLKKAVSDLKSAAEASVDYRKTASLSAPTEHGYGVMVYSPVRNEYAIERNFVYLSMLQAGCDTPWAGFLYNLYGKAAAADKVARTMPDGTYQNLYQGSVTVGLTVDETGLFLDEANVISLTDNGLKHACNYVVNQEEWLAFQYSNMYVADTDTYSLDFEFAPYLAASGIADKSITINVYSADEVNTIEVLSDSPVYSCTNIGSTVSVPVSSFCVNDKAYALQIVSENAVTYSFEGNHTTQSGTVVKASADRFDRVDRGDEQGYHSKDNALKFSTGYVDALAVTSDVGKTVNADWFTFSDPADNVEVTVSQTSVGAVGKDALKIELCCSDTTEESGVMVKATAVEDAVQTGKYTFESGVEINSGDYLKVSTALADNAACYYEIKFVSDEPLSDAGEVKASEERTASDEYPIGYIASTSVLEIPEKESSYAVFWSDGKGFSRGGQAATYDLQLSADENFSTVMNVTVGSNAAKIYNVDSGVTYSWRVRTQIDSEEVSVGGTDDENSAGQVSQDTASQASASEWKTSADKLTGKAAASPQKVTAQNDYVDDYMMARSGGKWCSGYFARHTGFNGAWTGTNATAQIEGKNRITDVFTGGGADASILVLTDDADGDAVFADDVYSARPDGTSGSRLVNVTKVYAGAGDDVVDFTSQRFSTEEARTFKNMTLCGGDGDDTLWTADVETYLFGDAGDDDLAGSTKNDVLSGGIGDDVMYGCGGSDVFCFCADWGNDVINQLSGSSVTLWFMQELGTWDDEAMTYTDSSGDNTIKVNGVASSDVSICYGSQSDPERYSELCKANAFAASSTTAIFA